VLDDIVGNTETIERLKIIARDGNMPHMIVSGMPGIGKTTSIVCLARQLLGDAYKEAVLELNASDERGVYLCLSLSLNRLHRVDSVSPSWRDRKRFQFREIMVDDG
jgi:DNA polymerase III delta prime subunit